MRGKPDDRRRFAIAYACSILIHALALVLLAVFAVQLIESQPAERLVADTEMTVRIETPEPAVQTHAPPAPRRPVAAPVLPRHELARVRPSAPPQPTPPPHPVVAPRPPGRPTVVPTATPTERPTATPTATPTERPTTTPTERPTIAPTERPTIAPTERPTVAPTERPSATPTERPAPAATDRPAPRSTERVAAVAVAAPPVAVPVLTSAPATAATARSLPPPPGPALTAAAAPPSPGSALSSLNARLRAALPSASPPGMQRVDLGTYSTNRVLDAYEAALAPPLEILAKTFGLIHTTRTVAHADSIAYVYERTRDLLGREVCRAYRITEHPLRDAPVPPSRLGPGAVEFPRSLADVKPVVETVEVSCRAPGMIPVEPGSITSPVPRHLTP